MRHPNLFFCLSLALWLPMAAQADTPSDTVLRIGSPDFNPYPIAIPEAKALGKTSPLALTVVTQALRKSFDLAARFKLLNPKSYLANPQKEGLQQSEIEFSDWQSVGADGLIKVGITESGGRFNSEYYFYDVASGRVRLGERYSGTAKELPAQAREFANLIVKSLTGQNGIFQTRIAAVKVTAKSRELWTMNLDGSDQKAVVRNGSINLLPAWGHDAKSLLLTSYVKGKPFVYRVAATGGAMHLVSGQRGLNTGPAVSPNGKQIALTLTKDGNSEVYVMNANGGGLKRLTNDWGIDTSPTWSPDGHRLAFVSSRWGPPHIFVMDQNGRGLTRLTHQGNYNQSPSWSPTGDLIAFTARDEHNRFDIFTVNVKTKQLRRLTQGQGNNEDPSFSPDGNNIVFTSNRTGSNQIWVMGLDGSKPTQITTRGRWATPAWSPR